MSFGKLVGFVTICFVLTLFTVFFVNIMGAVDEGVDMSGSDYEDEYNASSSAAQTTASFIGYFPIILGVGALLIAITGLKKLVR